MVALVAAADRPPRMSCELPPLVVSDSKVLVKLAWGATIPTVSLVPDELPMTRKVPPKRLIGVGSGRRSLLLAEVLSRIKLAAGPTTIVLKFRTKAPLAPRNRTV